MHSRRTAPALLVGLLLTVSGCVAVPSAPPAPARPPAGLSPADDRPPAPLPREWPSPTQDTPREALDTTDPAPVGDPPSPRPGRGRKAPGAPAAERTAPHRTGGRPPRQKATKPPKKPRRSSPAKTPRHAAPPRPVGTPADMRRLCHEAERIQVPYGVPALCRRSYGS
ncbi:hypothetical protein [Streptomyces sp. NPDC051921]|uniref:hypothetical protein n=1 Tax=Streptomyces sp. NPDC051921 TaxID=3155806 RepID=UPI0034428B88